LARVRDRDRGLVVFSDPFARDRHRLERRDLAGGNLSRKEKKSRPVQKEEVVKREKSPAVGKLGGGTIKKKKALKLAGVGGTKKTLPTIKTGTWA